MQDIALCGLGCGLEIVSSELPCRFKGVHLIPSTVKNVEDVCSAACLAIVNQILPCGEALHAASNVACRLARIWMLSEQPETLGDSANYSVSGLRTRPISPINEDLVRVPLSILGNTVAHYLLATFLARNLRPLDFTPSASFFNPSRPSYSTN